ncbi:DNA-directed RNA polymerase subunit beta [Alteribacillus bidgolensis]|uniref:DNA-directed RNA polymerase subunit beta n=1 Tax=Alteribacillus bidgolensis TaxID=930129 RepID=A0A1G8M550_9BACI|nr:DNA-directed RNA polymerase subunit beta [Alteribacillus bidgolensis]SDI63025.1 DNA-directed RNA polymerase subunit beta [Alteribacillus bidgolensis]
MNQKEESLKAPAAEEKHKEKETETLSETNEKDGKKKWFRFNKKLSNDRIRMVPIWVRLLIILGLFLISLIAGLIVGYALIGEGKSIQILNWETWQSLFNFMNGK